MPCAILRKPTPEYQADLSKTRGEVERFALNEYLVALAKGDIISDQDRDRIVEKLMAFTSLRRPFIENHNLRISRDRFLKELLRDENRQIGVLDSRITSHCEVRNFLDDQSVFRITGPLVATWNDYVRNELKSETQTPYILLSDGANASWNWGSAAHGYVDVAETLSQSMKKSGCLRILVASGYYDLDTSYFATEYTANHFALGPSLRKNVTFGILMGGTTCTFRPLC